MLLLLLSLSLLLLLYSATSSVLMIEVHALKILQYRYYLVCHCQDSHR